MTHSKRVLIVEDEYVMARALAFLFRKEGYEARICGDGAEALDLLLEAAPPVIILDLDLPRMNGFEICQRLKEDPATEQVRIIALTASPHEEDRSRMLALGADEFMTKPFDPVVLVRRVKELMEPPQAEE
jgi:DNA-binding response OmpR family regulator